MVYDVLVIGGGPAGYKAAERAGHKGMSVCLFEGRSLGGVCLNEGAVHPRPAEKMDGEESRQPAADDEHISTEIAPERGKRGKFRGVRP